MLNGSSPVSGGEPPIIRPHAQIRIVESKKKEKSKTKSALKKAKEKEQRREKEVEPVELTENLLSESFAPDGGVGIRPIVPLKHRYSKAMKTLKPYRTLPKEGREIPIENVGCLSYLTNSWMTGKMLKAYKSGLSKLDLYTVPERDQAKVNAERLQRIWEENQERSAKKGVKPSLARSVWVFARTRVILATIMIILSTIFTFLGPSIVLKFLLEYLNRPDQDESLGWSLVILLFLIQLLRNFTFTLNFNIGIHTAMRIFGATQYMGFSKLLRLAAPNEAALGQLVTFCTGDQERLMEAVVAGTLFTATPVIFVLSAAYAWYLVGPMTLLGLLVILLFYPLMGGVVAITSRLRLRVVAITDRRVTQMNEILNAIKLIKMYAWEKPFQQKVKVLRAQETKELRKAAFLQSVTISITPSITIIAAVVTFFSLTSTGFQLSAPDAFTIFSIFTSLQFTVATLPFSLRCLAEGKVALERLQKFLELPEYTHPGLTERDFDGDEKVAIRLKGANMAWPMAFDINAKKDAKKVKKVEKDLSNGDVKSEEPLLHTPCLFDLDLEVKQGQLIGVAGPVGAGKSSLISAIMGEMKQLEGEVKVRGRLAYVSQQAWIFNTTIRENILFGDFYRKEKYDQVIKTCCLQQDLESFPQGDLAEIGERGINLSGGQKQRVNLARALYAD